MRRLFLLVLIVAGVAGLGVYRGWFHFSSGGHDSITIKVDKNKIQEDKDKAVDEAKRLEQQAKDKATATPQKKQD